MEKNESDITYTSFLGTGWSFPPEFLLESGVVLMKSDEEDIEDSLKILLGTAVGERFLNPKYGVDMQEILFDAISTTTKTFLEDRVKTAILIYEPRINLLSLELDTSSQYEGKINIIISYQIRASNSRFNLVYPFYTTDANEVRANFVIPNL
ncbi:MULTISPECIES: GPW/gp25 family protein [Nostoc]|uniref:GPW/gp25 family protein n=2 Tax=Nostoc TaxID=1177 RepID=A0ABR8IHI3_9NOSO|nr:MULTISPECIES: GPW/gp25 family protein [Nostoc]MBD2563976.1 GPW/gp25 family protein [Nostoc linckia FACHB-391]MBD2650436.1 GPW/gp25 family protein [Nostoc foliaceum FACHB-393]